jgi:hypothetical protein
MGSFQNLSWFTTTRTWSLTLVLLFLGTPTLVVEPPSMIRISGSIGPCCLASFLSPSWDGSFLRTVWGILEPKTSSFLFWERYNPRCHVPSPYETSSTSWRTWGWDWALREEDIEESFGLLELYRSQYNWYLQGYRPFWVYWDVLGGVLSS